MLHLLNLWTQFTNLFYHLLHLRSGFVSHPVCRASTEDKFRKEGYGWGKFIELRTPFGFLFIYLFTSFSGPRPAQRECARTGLVGLMQGAISLPNLTTRKGWPHRQGLRPLLFSNSDVGSFTSHLPMVFRPYPRRLESLTICRCHYKGSTFFSVI